MCGIAGIARRGERPLPPPEVARAMLRAIAHRGPDARGEFRDDGIHLVGARLRVVGLDGGDPPLANETGSVVCVLNGEVYNHRVLRAGLLARGHRLASSCDAEVVPHLYEERGDGCVEALRGMFGLAVWDVRRRRLLLARDRIGIKPLFVAAISDYLVFASEIKAILASRLVPRALDPRSVDNLFTFSYPLAPRSMFAGIEELEPAHHLVLEQGRLHRRRYWALRFAWREAEVRKPDEFYRDGLRELVRATVRDHLQSDVPVGAYLSGGLDSTAIAALAHESTSAPLDTFSIGFEDPNFDEREFASRAATELGVPNHPVVLGREAAALYPRVLWHLELPQWFPIAIPLYALAAVAREAGRIVVLSGEGADELFGGYDCFRADKMRRAFTRPPLSALRPLAYRQLYRWAGTPPGLVEYLLDTHERSPSVERHYGTYPPWYDAWRALEGWKERLYGRAMRDALTNGDPEAEYASLCPPDLGHLHPLDAGLALEFRMRLPSWILLIGDRASMAHGVELRVPLLDHRVAEFCAAIPPELKMRGFSEKAILRDAMSGLVPETFRRRRKRPFYTPIGPWFFDEPAPEYVRELLTPSAVARAGWFDPAGVEKLRAEYEATPSGSFARMRLEFGLVAVLGVQLLHHLFVERPELTSPPEHVP